MNKICYCILILSAIILTGCTSGDLHLESPDGNLILEIKPGNNGKANSVASFSLKQGSSQILLPSPLFINMSSVTTENLKVVKSEKDTITRIMDK